MQSYIDKFFTSSREYAQQCLKDMLEQSFHQVVDRVQSMLGTPGMILAALALLAGGLLVMGLLARIAKAATSFKGLVVTFGLLAASCGGLYYILNHTNLPALAFGGESELEGIEETSATDDLFGSDEAMPDGFGIPMPMPVLASNPPSSLVLPPTVMPTIEPPIILSSASNPTPTSHPDHHSGTSSKPTTTSHPSVPAPSTNKPVKAAVASAPSTPPVSKPKPASVPTTRTPAPAPPRTNTRQTVHQVPSLFGQPSYGAYNHAAAPQNHHQAPTRAQLRAQNEAMLSQMDYQMGMEFHHMTNGSGMGMGMHPAYSHPGNGFHPGVHHGAGHH